MSHLQDRQVVVVAREILVIGEIFGGIDSGEGAEVVDEMRLVEIAAVQRDASPVDGFAAGDLAENLLEAAHAAEEFWRHANVLFEKLDEAAGAEAGFAGDVGDFCGGRPRQEIADGVFDDGLAVEHAGGALEERQFQDAQLCRRRPGSQRTFT